MNDAVDIDVVVHCLDIDYSMFLFLFSLVPFLHTTNTTIILI